ncbi:hypothetical protein [Phytoactinopolyspora halotolerans]|uniref:PRC-barrel domain containing protein n=1 Tax=Phytoactinopolyspora halotolerans TaxID=1981512 RepID=A0A6L9SH13_9ACTN|nr:hypothetical protein [Phytoactinopolyspora halotolerans]NEE04489.1 hypothetical protein [Phytoactinopolyspora halotolerans]
MAGTSESGRSGPMAEVREGMRVLDRSGQELGSVEDLKMGDLGADTSAGQLMDERTDMVQELGRAFTGGSDMPPQLAERLRRLGYLKASRTMSPVDVYVAGDQIERVDNGTVYLNVERDDLYAT